MIRSNGARAQARQPLPDAARSGVPQNLVPAVAWQESGWTRHVIARAGGIGAMQIMLCTAKWLNTYLGAWYDRYRLHDNIELGVAYPHLLWQGDLPRITSAYNEGERNMRTRGVFSWRDVTSVTARMRRFS
jgi:soluble lytic murein transglycosylase-like protein